jgi:hypothetical protein
MKQNEVLDVSGHLEVWKVYETGDEELFFDDHNVITSGMGAGVGMLYAGSGSARITDFQIRYFQIGVSGDSIVDTYGVSQYSLVSALGQVDGVSDYQSGQSNIPLSEHQLMDWNGGPKTNSEAVWDWYFGLIPDNAIKRVDLNSVTYIIYIDRHTANNHTLNEIGLYMDNPLGEDPKRSNMVAYRPFTNIVKTDNFSLVFKWTLNF